MGLFNVRFGSKADMCNAPTHVRFTANSDRKSGHAQMVMSAFTPESGRVRRKPSCLLWANSGLQQEARATTRALQFVMSIGPRDATQ